MVLYWMIANRRLTSNFALQRAVEAARDLGKPLVILEALRAGHRWASDRLHRFVIDGMAGHARAIAPTPVTYLPYIEPTNGAGKGLLEALAADACLVVTDDFPCFFLPRMTRAAAARLAVRLEAVDSNGLLPMRAAARPFHSAFAFRAHVQKTLRDHLEGWPQPIELATLPPRWTGPGSRITARWPMASLDTLTAPETTLARLPIDHDVGPVRTPGGAGAGRAALDRFVAGALDRYAGDHNQPQIEGTSRLSPYLHFGHLSAHDVFSAVMTAERWTSRRLSPRGGGRREGWWGVGPGAEAFLDQLVTWREIGFNLCVARPDDYDRYASLPDWARRTLEAHAGDGREFEYSIDQFGHARTHDPLWNAAQRQLVREGWMHNYLRMLWGKKILEWTRTPEQALDVMIALMDRHALDGRDPNSYNGYGWVLGRFDRPWAPERPIFGAVRYMSSASTMKKLRLKRFLTEYGPFLGE
jgi:deoxyribodipyrimidine photo-lyase